VIRDQGADRSLLRRLALAAEAEDDIPGRQHRANAVAAGGPETGLQRIPGRGFRATDPAEEGDMEGHA
jgi:hypothetical protein